MPRLVEPAIDPLQPSCFVQQCTLPMLPVRHGGVCMRPLMRRALYRTVLYRTARSQAGGAYDKAVGGERSTVASYPAGPAPGEEEPEAHRRHEVTVLRVYCACGTHAYGSVVILSLEGLHAVVLHFEYGQLLHTQSQSHSNAVRCIRPCAHACMRPCIHPRTTGRSARGCVCVCSHGAAACTA